METIYKSDTTRVFVLDSPGPGGACHEYEIGPLDVNDGDSFAGVDFQKGLRGPGVNGCINEDLLAIVIHRLEGFQSGGFPCEENKKALNLIKNGLIWLEQRTKAEKNAVLKVRT